MFQHKKKKKINLLKFPVIMAPRVLGRQVNTSSVKKSVFCNKAGETQEYSEKVLTKFSQLVEAKKLNILKIDQIGGTELREMAEDLELIPNKMYSKKSDVALRNELETIAGYLLHEQKRGQGVCHQYVQVGKTSTNPSTVRKGSLQLKNLLLFEHFQNHLEPRKCP